MNCPNCGTSNPDTATLCVHCGRQLSAPPPPPQPQSSYTPPPPPVSHTPPQNSYVPPPRQAVPVGGAPPPNYLLFSIFTTLCCCLPLGIVAIIFAAQVNSKFAAGDYAGAQAASANAKKWAIIALIVGLLAQVLWIVFAGGSAMLQGFSEGFSS